MDEEEEEAVLQQEQMTRLGPAEIPQAFREKFELDLECPLSEVTTKELINLILDWTTINLRTDQGSRTNH